MYVCTCVLSCVDDEIIIILNFLFLLSGDDLENNLSIKWQQSPRACAHGEFAFSSAEKNSPPVHQLVWDFRGWRRGGPKKKAVCCAPPPFFFLILDPPLCTSTTHGPFIAPNPPKFLGDCSAMNGPWVLVHTLTKGKPKTWYNVHFLFNPINSASFHIGCCPQFTHPARAPVKQS